MKNPSKCPLIVCISLLLCISCISQHSNALTDEKKNSGWVPLFNGADLSGWRELNKTTPISPAWVIEEGVLAFRPDKKETSEPVGIITIDRFDHFELRLEWKISLGGNSGVFFHVVEHEGLGRGVRSFLAKSADGEICWRLEPCENCLARRSRRILVERRQNC